MLKDINDTENRDGLVAGGSIYSSISEMLDMLLYWCFRSIRARSVNLSTLFQGKPTGLVVSNLEMRSNIV